MADCDSNCSSCGEQGCGSRTTPQITVEAQNEASNVKKVIGIVSGKGGVGKSLVTGLSAVVSQRMGYSAAILDADITGPSIPKMFGIKEKARGTDKLLYPVQSSTGIKLMSLNLLKENESDPVVWRGSIVTNVVKQFWTDTVWGDVDFMFVDMPPGTGDVPLTVFQSLPVDGIIIVTSPQELVSMIVEKSVNMAKMMNVPIIGIVENMAYLECPDCGKRIDVFGKSNLDEIAKKHDLDILARIPIQPKLASKIDAGKAELFSGDFLDGIIPKLNEIYNKS